ncbi:MAG: hypothetical protein ACP5LE_02285 [Thermoplasmata archaeon]
MTANVTIDMVMISPAPKRAKNAGKIMSKKVNISDFFQTISITNRIILIKYVRKMAKVVSRGET